MDNIVAAVTGDVAHSAVPSPVIKNSVFKKTPLKWVSIEG
jgi:hypothetical protein